MLKSKIWRISISILVVIAVLFAFDKLSEGGLIRLVEWILGVLFFRDTTKDENSVIRNVVKRIKERKDEVSNLSDDELASRASRKRK